MSIEAGVQFLFVKVPICKEGHIPLWQRTIQSHEKVHQSLLQLNDIAPPWTRMSLLSLSSNAKSFFAVSYPTRKIRWISDTVILPSFSTISKIFFSSFNREQHCLLLHSKPHPFNFKNQRYRRFRIPLYTVSYRLSRERKGIFGHYCNTTLLPWYLKQISWQKARPVV